MKLKTILHPTDFSESAARALSLAATLAASHHATLHLYYADLLHGESPGEATEEFDTYVERARTLLETAGGDTPPRLEVTRERSVSAFDAIMRVATERTPDVIVMGTHGRSGFRELLMGSTTEKVLRYASCDVLTVRAEAAVPVDGRFRKLLVPVDFSQRARRALDGVRALREEGSATTYLVHVVEPLPPMYFAGDISTLFELDGDLYGRIESSLREWAKDLTDCEVRVGEGSAAVEVARIAEELEVELIIMATKGLTGAERLLVGSVTERVCRLATVPVLAMR